MKKATNRDEINRVSLLPTISYAYPTRRVERGEAKWQ